MSKTPNCGGADKDRAKAKIAVQEAAKMMKAAKEDDKPFNANASLILAKAAHVVKLYDIAETFYNHELQQAIKAGNGPKIRQGYEGLIDLQWEMKRYDDVVDTCERRCPMPSRRKSPTTRSWPTVN